MSGDRDLDIAVYGATGFVGQLTAQYLARRAPGDVRIGLAGRVQERLAEVRNQLGNAAKSWPLLVADSEDAKSMAKLAAATRVVVTTVGPYRRNGLNLVGACVEASTDYADLSGEVLFMRDSIDRYHDAAAKRGVRIVHSCGFDSIPSDLGVLLLHQQAAATDGGELEDTTFVVRGFGGGLSGGTLASGKGQLDEIRADPALARIVFDPYALSPDRAEEPELGDERDLTRVVHDDDLGMWLAPFMMAGINTRAVRRSNALQGWAYGRRFRYREVMGFDSDLAGWAKANAVAGALGAVYGALQFGPTRALLDRVLPKPGEGPSEKARSTGFYKIDIHARTSNGDRYVAHVSQHGDPGYQATSVLLGESALCLALGHERLPKRAGVLTPATAMGTVLVERLRAAGVTLTVEKLS